MSAVDRGGKYRKVVYNLVEKAIGRIPTAEELAEIKKALLDYAKAEGDHFRQTIEKLHKSHADEVRKLKAKLKK